MLKGKLPSFFSDWERAYGHPLKETANLFVNAPPDYRQAALATVVTLFLVASAQKASTLSPDPKNLGLLLTISCGLLAATTAGLGIKHARDGVRKEKGNNSSSPEMAA